jgi:hypothetical protein
MRIKPLPPRRKTVFYTSVGLAVTLAAVGWFFSFKQNWAMIKFSPDSFSKLSELKEGVQEIGADLKNGAEVSVTTVAPDIKETVSDITAAVEQRKEAANLVGDIIKENLEAENQYGETQENPQTPTE